MNGQTGSSREQGKITGSHSLQQASTIKHLRTHTLKRSAKNRVHRLTQSGQMKLKTWPGLIPIINSVVSVISVIVAFLPPQTI